MDQRAIAERFAEPLSWPDDRFLGWAAAAIAVPNIGPADSFVHHAPLELMARAALLSMVHHEYREHARQRIAWLVAEYQATTRIAEADDEPLPTMPAAEALAGLLRAVQAGDLVATDRYACAFLNAGTAAEVRRGLGPMVGPSLAAAAHGSIGLYLLGRTPAVPNAVIRGTLCEMARQPSVEVPIEGLATAERPLVDALLDTPLRGTAAVEERIMPLVRNGTSTASEVLARVSCDPTAARQALSRVAAWSMLQDDPGHAPYGWSHTLTIPQGVMGLGLPDRQAVAIAASQVVGFRVSMSTERLDPGAPVPELPRSDARSLATAAALHFDAHLVKYTLASFEAVAADPEMGHLYLSAAAYLGSLWAAEPDDGFFTEPSLDVAARQR